jgi:outer membrane protein assembly factor BamA
MRVEPGVKYRLDLEAPTESREIAEDAFPDPAEEELHPAQTDALAELVEERLQESGYLLAEVSAALSADGEMQVLHLEVDPGRKLKIAAVDFPGADHVSHKRLSATVQVKKGGVGGRFKQSVSNRTLESDRKAVEDLFHGEGFPFAVVAPPELAPVDNEDAVTVLFGR